MRRLAGVASVVEATVDEIRDLIDNLPDNPHTKELTELLDEAQGVVKTKGGCAFVIIKIVP